MILVFFLEIGFWEWGWIVVFFGYVSGKLERCNNILMWVVLGIRVFDVCKKFYEVDFWVEGVLKNLLFWN